MKKVLIFSLILILVLVFGCPEFPLPSNEKYCEQDADCKLYSQTCDCVNKNISENSENGSVYHMTIGCLKEEWDKIQNTLCVCENKQCIKKAISIETADYEVHEWGVLAGCSTTDDFLLTSRPEQTMLVKEPVIYIHSNDSTLTEFNLNVIFLNGKPVLTYPEALIKETRTLEWKNVKIKENCTIKKEVTKGFNPIPLEQIIPQLNDVDADCLETNGEQARFLFYEGEMQFKNNVSVIYDKNEETAIIKNNADYSVFDLSFALGKGLDFISMKSLIGSIQELKAGEEKTIELKPDNAPDLKEKLTSLGFTEKEALSFRNLWYNNFFYPANTEEFARLSYRLPEEETEKLIQLKFEPKPVKILRSLWVLVKVE